MCTVVRDYLFSIFSLFSLYFHGQYATIVVHKSIIYSQGAKTPAQKSLVFELSCRPSVANSVAEPCHFDTGPVPTSYFLQTVLAPVPYINFFIYQNLNFFQSYFY